jgi:hypothetical protein
VRAEWKQKGLEKFSEFLEEKRNSSTSENQNNGLVLLFRGEEELSVMLAAWQATGHNDLMLDTVKGFGCLDTYMEVVRNNNRFGCSCQRVALLLHMFMTLLPQMFFAAFFCCTCILHMSSSCDLSSYDLSRCDSSSHPSCL